MTLLAIVVAIILDLLLLAPFFGAIFSWANGLSLPIGFAVICIPKLIVYGLLAYVGVRFLKPYGKLPPLGFVICFGVYWLGWHWAHSWPGRGWIGLLFTYGSLLVVPIGLAVGAVVAGWGRLLPLGPRS